MLARFFTDPRTLELKDSINIAPSTREYDVVYQLPCKYDPFVSAGVVTGLDVDTSIPSSAFIAFLPGCINRTLA
jgi:hypothetical protein